MSTNVDEVSEAPQISSTPTGVFGLRPPSGEKAAAAVLFFLSLAYLCIFRRHCSLEPDEGIVLQGAERILHGEIPYHDFFMFYTPGSFYLVAAIFKIFGDSFVIARFSLAVAGAICSLITFLLARRVCSLGTAVCAGVLSTVSGCAYRFLVLHNWYSTLMCCVCVYAVVQFYEGRREFWAFATGLFMALTILFEQSKGAGLCLGLLLAWLILRLWGRAQIFRKQSLLAIVTGFAMPLFVTFAYFGSQNSLVVMLQSWFWPLRHYTDANQVPYGWQNWSQEAVTEIFRAGPVWLRILKVLAVSPGMFVPLLPLIAIALLIYRSLQLRSAPSVNGRDSYYVILCSVFAGLLTSVEIARPDVIHFMYLAPLWYVVLAWILRASTKSRWWNALRAYFGIYTAAAFGLLALALLLNATGARVSVATRRGFVMMSKEDPVLAYVESHSAPRQRLLVYPYLPLYNYLTATMSPARYDYFQSGMNTPEQAREIIAALQSNNDASVLFEPWFAEKIANSWPQTPLSAIANDPVSGYIATHYQICKMLTSSENAGFEYMVPRGKVCP